MSNVRTKMSLSASAIELELYLKSGAILEKDKLIIEVVKYQRFGWVTDGVRGLCELFLRSINRQNKPLCGTIHIVHEVCFWLSGATYII